MDPATKTRAEDWLNGHDTGISSLSIFHWMTAGLKVGHGPSDPEDLGRCLRLLERFPEWKERMTEMAAVSRDWAALVPHWDEVVASFIEEAGGAVPERWAQWSAQKTYHLMKSINVQVWAA